MLFVRCRCVFGWAGASKEALEGCRELVEVVVFIEGRLRVRKQEEEELVFIERLLVELIETRRETNEDEGEETCADFIAEETQTSNIIS